MFGAYVILALGGYALYKFLEDEESETQKIPAPQLPAPSEPSTPTVPGGSGGPKSPGLPGSKDPGETGEVDPAKHHQNLVNSVKARMAEMGFVLDAQTSQWIETMTDEDLVCLLGALGQTTPDLIVAAGKACVTGSVSSHRVEYFATALAGVLRDTKTPVKPITIGVGGATAKSPGWPSLWDGKPSDVPNLGSLPLPLQQTILDALRSGNPQTLEVIATSVRMLGFGTLADYLLGIAEQFRGGA